MLRHAHRHVLLAGVLLGLLCLEGAAAAATPWTTHFPYTTTTLTHADVKRLVTRGQRLRLTSKIAVKTDVRLFVYARTLDRVGRPPVQDPNQLPNSRVYISRLAHVTFEHPGVHSITLHVDKVYRAALLRAGTIKEGYYYAGYQKLHHG